MTALDDLLPVLRCPVCRRTLARDGRAVGCAAGHRFDLARQGYVNLAVGRAHPGTGDSAAMVDARDAFLDAGHFTPLDDVLRDVLADVDGPVVDLAGGTGHHLDRALPAAGRGLVVDLSAAALRRAARRSPDRVAAVGADVWAALPLQDRCAAAVLSVFGPRDPAEIARVLRPAGRFVVVSPRTDHLRELVAPMGLLTVDPEKPHRQRDAFADFRPVDRHTVTYGMSLTRDDAVAVAAMGPAARHATAAELAARAARLDATTAVTAAVDVTVFGPPA